MKNKVLSLICNQSLNFEIAFELSLKTFYKTNGL